MEIQYHLNASGLFAAHAHVRDGARRRMSGALAGGMRSGRDAPWLQADGDYALALTPAGISLRAPDGRVGFYAWPEVAALEIAGDFLYLHLRRDGMIAVPRAAVEDGGAVLAREVDRLWAAHPDNAGLTLPAAAPAPEPPLHQALANLRQAARVAFFLGFDPRSFRASWGALAWLMLADLLAAIAVDYFLAGPTPIFNWGGVGVYGADALLFFGWAVAVSRFVEQRATLLRLLVMAQSSLLFIGLIGLPFYLNLERQMQDSEGLLLPALLVCVPLLWNTAALARILRRLYGRGAPSAILLGAAYALFSMTLYSLAPGELYVNAASAQPGADQAAPDAAVPEGGSDDAGDDVQGDDGQDGGNLPGDAAYRKVADKLDVEDVFYRQTELVSRTLAAVQPPRPGETGLYFVGFAGEAEEHEFGNEVRYARNLLDRRFNTAGHSLALINGLDTVNDTPLANTHNLDAVLQGLASRMDRENDVLFLYLSSHGAQDHRLSVSFWPLEMDDLKAEKLKEILDKSGIRNRVIVVSACYSGGFLDVLKDDNTLVLTASRRDHVAYGCGDITEYTYFGEAYFVKALAHQDSFIAAFEEARGLIAAREEKERVGASGPQIYVGRNIVRVLEKLKVAPVGVVARGCQGNCPGESR